MIEAAFALFALAYSATVLFALAGSLRKRLEPRRAALTALGISTAVHAGTLYAVPEEHRALAAGFLGLAASAAGACHAVDGQEAMSDIALDLSSLYYVMAFGPLAPVVAFFLARLRPPFWPRFLAATLGGPLLAFAAGTIADALKPDDEIAFLSLMAAGCIQAPISLAILLFGRRSP